MATYKGIKGFEIQVLDDNPSPSAATEGQVWYSGGSLKGMAFSAGTGSWASGGNMNTSRSLAFSFGTASTAAIMASGYNNTNVLNCESYNGTAWTEVNNTSDAKIKRAAFGTQTSLLYAGGDPGAVTDTETWDGTSFSDGTALNVGKRGGGGYGSSNAAGGIVGGRLGAPA